MRPSSFDGRFIAYESLESGQAEVVVRPFPDVNSGRWEVSSNGGIMPVWNPAEPELFFSSAQGLMALAYETEPQFTPGTVTVLFDMTPYASALTTNRRIAVAPDGQRFLLLKNLVDQTGTTDASLTEITVVLNWFEELKELVPLP